MNIEIQSFDPSDSPRRQEFIDFPYEHYSHLRAKEDALWIPPLRMSQEKLLDPNKSVFLKSAKLRLFLAKNRGKTIGRIAAIQNSAHDTYHRNQETGFYGFFESIEHTETARQLFMAAGGWLKASGYSRMVGPVNPSVHHECGLLIRGQSQHPTIGTTWNPKYYVDLHEKNGLTPTKDLVAYAIRVEHDSILSDHKKKVEQDARQNQRIRFRDFRLTQFERDAEICFEIYNRAWERNWGFYQLDRTLFLELARDITPILDPRFAFIAEVNQKPAGFMLALPDINHLLKHIPDGRLFPTGWLKLSLGRPFLKSVRIITLGVSPEYRHLGIFTAFTQESFRRARKHGVIGGEASWILEDNDAMTRPWEELGAPLYRRWRLYEQNLTD